jgi:hypothetical protein
MTVEFNKKVRAQKIKDVFSFGLYSSDGTNILFNEKSVKLKNNGKNIEVKVIILQTIENGKFIFKKKPWNRSKPDEGVLYDATNSDVTFNEDVTINDISLNLDNFLAKLDNIGDVGRPVMKTATAFTMMLSVGASIALIKIFQMMDYMILFSVVHPFNFSQFVQIFSSNFFNDFPNIFNNFVDDNCGEIRPKFLENEMSCQFFSNCGSLIFIFFIIGILKVTAWLMKVALT